MDLYLKLYAPKNVDCVCKFLSSRPRQHQMSDSFSNTLFYELVHQTVKGLDHLYTQWSAEVDNINTAGQARSVIVNWTMCDNCCGGSRGSVLNRGHLRRSALSSGTNVTTEC